MSAEAGLHLERIAEEKQRLERVLGVPVRASRHHCLAWREVEHGRAVALDGDGALAACLELAAATRKHGGELGLPWHNTLLAPEPGHCHPRRYRRFLETGIGEGA